MTKTITTLRLALLTMGLLLIGSCAKELPEKVSEDIQRDVHAISLFSESEVTIETVALSPKDEATVQTAAISRDELNQQNSNDVMIVRPVKFVSGPEALRPFFLDLSIESARAGEQFKVKFKLTKSFVIAYIEIEGQALSVRREALAEGNLSPLFQFPVSSYGILDRAENDLGEKTRTVIFKSRDMLEASHVQVSSLTERRMILGDNINLVDKVFADRQKHFDTKSEYLYVPMTMGTPREVVQADPFYQGQEKIVKLKFTEKGLEVFELERDPRFRDNHLNNTPVLVIPGEYQDYRCKRDENGRCVNPQEGDAGLSWKDKRYFLPQFESLQVKEINVLDISTVEADPCVIPLDNELVDYTIKNGVINIELEKTYKLNSSWECIQDNYFRDTESFRGFSTAGFKVRFFYSLVRLDDIASKNYKEITYPIQDHDTFGFFKNMTERLDDNFDSQRRIKTYTLNRWDTSKGEVVYHLSDTFNKAENKIFKDATYKAIEGVNRSLDLAQAGFRLRLEEPSGKKAGDLRNNMIVLIDDPLSNGLLGYGPTVTNPKTGEIVQGHVNMYSGVLKTLTRSVWEAMADHTEDMAQEKSNSDDKALRELARGNAPLLSNIQRVSHRQIKQKEIEASLKKNQQQALQRLKARTLARRSESEQLELSDVDKKLIQEEARLARYSENNAFATEFYRIAHTAKALIPGIKELKGVLNKKGTLKRWNQLNADQQKKARDIIAVHTYTSTFVHEFGHNLGLRHNFIGSYDAANFYSEEEAKALGLRAAPAYSSIMDYAFSELNELAVFGKYDVAALRFAYGRKVELSDGKLVAVNKPLTQLTEELTAQGKSLKSYQFCTDENAGLSATCNRFDEGSTLVEIAKHYKKKYDDYYKYRNFRDDRDTFQAEDLIDYTIARLMEFNRVRDLFEEWEFFSSIFGAELMAQGCTPEMTAQYPICKDINDRKEVVLLAGQFFVDILKTPDHLCVVSKEGEEETSLKKLEELYDGVKYDIDYVTTSCFDPAITAALAEEGETVVAEGGKFLNGFKDNHPEHVYSNDRAVRGIWTDKLMAVKALFQRQSGKGITERDFGAMVDHPTIAGQVGNFLAHITLGQDLQTPIPFKKADGTAYKQKYAIDSSYIITDAPPRALWFLRPFLSLPSEGSALLNPALLKMASRWGVTNDLTHKNSSRDLVNTFTVRRYPLGSNLVSSKDLALTTIGDNIYGASTKNSFARIMIDSVNSVELLESVGKEKVLAIAERRMSPPMPDGLSEAEQIAYNLEEGLLDALIGAASQGIELEREFLVAQFGEELADKLLAAYALGKDGLEKVKLAIEQAAQAPADATNDEKKVYALDFSIIEDFLTGKLDSKVEGFLEVLPELPDYVTSL